jgi:transcriptional regulator with XRE-family HTH domain
MITTHQCRAARGLIGWTQKDLADQCGLSKTAVNNFEKGHSHIKAESLRAICHAFQGHGVEFLGQDGLRHNSEHAALLSAQDIMQDISRTLGQAGGEILALYLCAEKSQSAIRMIEDHTTNAPLHWKIISPYNAPADISASGTIKHRQAQTAQDPPLQIAYFIYGNKIALEFPQSNRLCVINSRRISEAQRQHFHALWHITNP